MVVKVFSERPRDLLSRAQMYTNYKHHNTVKCLVGIHLRYLLSISKGLGGGGGGISDELKIVAS